MRRALVSLALLAAGCSMNAGENTASTGSALSSPEALYIDGQLVGWVTHVDDGGGSARFRLGQLPGRVFYPWMRAAFDDKEHSYKNGQVVGYGPTPRERGFVDARLSMIAFETWKGGSIVLQIDGKLGPSVPSNITPPPPPPPGTGMPTFGAPQCACNAVGIRDVSFGFDGTAVATVTVPWKEPGGPSGGTDPTLEFDAANGKELTVPVLFDDYENGNATITLRDVQVVDARGALFDEAGRKLRAIVIRAKAS